MGAKKWLADKAVSLVIIIVTLYFVMSLGVTWFKLTGQIVEGERMYFDLMTPGWAGLITFQAICAALIAAGFYLRRLLRRGGRQPQ